MSDAPLDLALKARLATIRLGRPHRHYVSVGSTQAEAAAWAEDGAPTGALVTADHQRTGRGRLGRTWADEPGRDLALSLVLRPALRPERLGLLPLSAGVAVADALAQHTSGVTLKWPNDVRIGGKKAAGILAETRWRTCGSGSQSPTVLLGIGVNVNRQAFPSEIADRATSLALARGAEHDRAALLADLLLSLEHVRGLTPEALVARAEAILDALGEHIEDGFPGTDRPPLAGAVLGIAGDGALRLSTAQGDVRVHAGETTIRV